MTKLLNKLGLTNLNERETKLTIFSAFLLGLVIGLIASPKGIRSYGCDNGNYYGKEGCNDCGGCDNDEDNNNE